MTVRRRDEMLVDILVALGFLVAVALALFGIAFLVALVNRADPW